MEPKLQKLPYSKSQCVSNSAGFGCDTLRIRIFKEHPLNARNQNKTAMNTNQLGRPTGRWLVNPTQNFGAVV